MWQRLFRKKICIGIDLGSSEIKAVAVKKSGSGVTVEAAEKVSLPAGVMDNGKIIDAKGLSETLKLMADKIDMKKKQLVIAATGKNVVVRQLKLPQMPVKEIEQAVKWEAEKYVPLPQNELIIDHVNFGLVDKEDKQLFVLMVAVPKKDVFDFYETFSLGGLELSAIDIEPLALWRLMGDVQAGSGPAAIIDFGAKQTSLLITHNNCLDFNRSFDIGGDTVTDAIAEKLGVDFAAAQQIKEQKAAMPAGSQVGAQSLLNLALLEGVGRLLHEIRRSLDFYKIQSQGNAVSQIFISGGMANMPGIIKFFQNELELPVSFFNSNLSWSSEDLSCCNEEGVLDPAWAVAAGLALWEVK